MFLFQNNNNMYSSHIVSKSSENIVCNTKNQFQFFAKELDTLFDSYSFDLMSVIFLFKVCSPISKRLKRIARKRMKFIKDIS